MARRLQEPYAFWLARLVAIAHAMIVGFTVYGAVGVILGRFTSSSLQQPFTWVFIAACVGQLASYAIFRECILTRWEKDLLQQSRSPRSYTGTFLQRFIPNLPDDVAHTGIPLIILAILVGLVAQMWCSGTT
jgi:hypothetical protein